MVELRRAESLAISHLTKVVSSSGLNRDWYRTLGLANSLIDLIRCSREGTDRLRPKLRRRLYPFGFELRPLDSLQFSVL